MHLRGRAERRRERRRQRLRPAARRVAHEALAVERQLDLAQGERDPAHDLRQAVGGDVEPRVARPRDDPREAHRRAEVERADLARDGDRQAGQRAVDRRGEEDVTVDLQRRGAGTGDQRRAEPTRLSAGHCAARALSRSHSPMPLPSPPTRPGGNEIAMSLIRCVRSSRVMELTAVVEAPAVAGVDPGAEPGVNGSGSGSAVPAPSQSTLNWLTAPRGAAPAVGRQRGAADRGTARRRRDEDRPLATGGISARRR